MNANDVSVMSECIVAIRREIIATAKEFESGLVYDCEFNDGVKEAYTVIAQIINETAGSLFNGRYSCPLIDKERPYREARERFRVIKGGKKK